jgi:hypothetical protein
VYGCPPLLTHTALATAPVEWINLGLSSMLNGP